MIKKLYSLVLFGVMGFSVLLAQISTEKHGITYKLSASDYYGAPGDLLEENAVLTDFVANWGYAAEVGYNRYLSNSFNLTIPFKMGVSALRERGYNGSMYGSTGANLIYKFNNGYFLKEDACFAPYIYGGLAGKRFARASKDRWDLESPLGLGFNFRLGENWNFVVEGEKRFSHLLKRNNWLYSAGCNYTFGGSVSKDTDGDGIADDKDSCPSEAGLKQYGGCPDTDGDGLVDSRDECPMVFGDVAINGCPDADKDGIADKDDQCPEVAGIAAFNGCPDTDADGVADKEDECPNNAGLRSLNGCPDTDGDGIADKTDKCPTMKGISAFAGCPDTDNDGVQDSEDICPNAKGLATFRGCPDTDADGVQDSEDSCPNEKGTREFKGCPPPVEKVIDTDGDGIADKEDECPTVKGLADYKGCPPPTRLPPVVDTDDDGIPDSADKCPTQAGTAANNGCPEIKVEDKKVLLEAMYIAFETGSAGLKKESMATLDKVYDVLQKYPDYYMSITGHTDNTGNAAANQKLSETRAKTCYDYLLKKGVKTERLSYAGLGDSSPIGDNKTPEGRKQNRRVEFLPYVK